MDDFDSASVTLKVTDWCQAVANCSNPEGTMLSDPPGLTLSADCVPSDDYLQLSSSEEFSRLQVGVTLTKGPLLLGSGTGWMTRDGFTFLVSGFTGKEADGRLTTRRPTCGRRTPPDYVP